MSAEIWAAFALFAFVAAATPGPNNLLLLGSGLRVGVWRTLPFIVGISIGFSTLLVAVGYGLGQMFERFPALQVGLQIVGTAYFVYLAWTLFRSGRADNEGNRRDLDFWMGVLFQAVNPKAWLMCITAIALYLPSTWSAETLAVMVATFVVLGFPANVAWAGAGQLLRPLVASEARMRIFNAVMAALLILSIVPVWLSVR
ncbi:LysE family translocator [Boseongicola sp. H5]|uniref:LysE family translocator n=1 Tax=Boseongicola sp. H5 TaxID=2763261 RepID=UPI001D0AA7EF|nr:LysE family translocator [Boseongicola sp. H5]